MCVCEFFCLCIISPLRHLYTSCLFFICVFVLQVDCFSFGMFMYELLTTHQPYEHCDNVKEHVLEGGRPALTHRVMALSQLTSFTGPMWSVYLHKSGDKDGDLLMMGAHYPLLHSLLLFYKNTNMLTL